MQTAQRRSPSYIAEVDGLRAFAVVAVLLYHAYPNAVPGGFIGVDIFFVVSGFVIARTYLERLVSGQTSLARFYLKRIRRLAPAYAVVLAVSTVAAFALLSPPLLRSFGVSLLAQPLYAQNITFWIEGSYFESALTKPLLHTWSLAVEEQFYLLFGALVLLSRWRRGLLWPLLVFASVASLAAGYLLIDPSPKTAFFLVPTRVWQFAAGIVALAIVRRVPEQQGGVASLILGVAASLGCLASVVAFNDEAVFPGPQALIATVSVVVLLVLFECRPSRAYVGFRSRWVRRLGELSYSLYLWHWPILVFATVAAGRVLSPLEATVALMVSYGLSEATYRIIEDPVRRSRRLPTTKALLRPWLLTSTAFAAGGLLFVLTGGALFRYEPSVRVLYSAMEERRNNRCSYFWRVSNPTGEVCPANETARTAEAPSGGFLLLGDSHAHQLKPSLGEAGDQAGVPVYISVRNCDLDQFGEIPYCTLDVLDAELREAKAAGIEHVVAVSLWEADLPGYLLEPRYLDEAARRVIEAGFTLHLSEQVPVSERLNPRRHADAILESMPMPGAYTRVSYRDAIRNQRDVFTALASTYPSQVIINQPEETVCPNSECDFESGGYPNYADPGHVTRPVADRLVGRFYVPFFDTLPSVSSLGPPSAP